MGAAGSAPTGHAPTDEANKAAELVAQFHADGEEWESKPRRVVDLSGSGSGAPSLDKAPSTRLVPLPADGLAASSSAPGRASFEHDTQFQGAACSSATTAGRVAPAADCTARVSAEVSGA